MITLITGENTFENERILARVIKEAPVTAEKIDGSELELRNVPDLLMGGTLFANERLVVIKNLSESKALWNDFEPWIERVSEDVHLVLLESKPDKRTKTFKALQKNAKVQESKLWSERDIGKAQQWVETEATELGFTLDKKSAQALVSRVGVDQWGLFRALEKLQFIENITPEKIEECIEANPIENVFQLFDAALKGNIEVVKRMLNVFELTEEPYRLFGLLSTQALQLVTLVVTEKPAPEVAKEIGVHPFALSKMAPHAKAFTVSEAKKLLEIFAEADQEMKTSASDPWLLLERALLKVSMLSHKK